MKFQLTPHVGQPGRASPGVKKAAHQLVLTTCPDQAVAERIARALVEERLAACVNILPPMQSLYLWRGNIESATEHL